MPAARLWRRIKSHHERVRKETEEKVKFDTQWRASDLFTIARAISYGFYLNKDLPTRKKDAEKKKPTAQDWLDIEEAHENHAKFRAAYQQGHRSLYDFCNFYGIPNFFEKPPEPVEDKPKTLGNFPNTKEGRAARKKAVQEMEARIMKNLDKIIAAGNGEDEIGSASEPQEGRGSEFLERQGLKRN